MGPASGPLEPSVAHREVSLARLRDVVARLRAIGFDCRLPLSELDRLEAVLVLPESPPSGGWSEDEVQAARPLFDGYRQYWVAHIDRALADAHRLARQTRSGEWLAIEGNDRDGAVVLALRNLDRAHQVANGEARIAVVLAGRELRGRDLLFGLQSGQGG
jgi:hypothetical protein